METNVKVVLNYKLATKAQRELVLAGAKVAIDQTIEVEMPAREAVELGVAEVTASGEIQQTTWVGARTLQKPRVVISYSGDLRADEESLNADHVLTAAEALALLRGKERALVAAKAAVMDSQEWRDLLAKRERDAAEKMAREARVREAIRAYLKGEGKVPDMTTLDSYDPDRKAATAEIERRAEAAKLALAAERARWIEKHGSERLRKCLALGMAAECQGVYRSERLAVEFTGFVWDNDETKEESEIRNPSLAALTALEEARKLAPDAYLCKVRAEDGGEGEWREAVRIDDPSFAPNSIAYRLID